MTSNRGKYAGNAPLLRFGDISADGLALAEGDSGVVASGPTICSATGCSRSLDALLAIVPGGKFHDAVLPNGFDLMDYAESHREQEEDV